MRDRTAAPDEAPARAALTEVGLDLLAVHERRLIRPVLDVCLQRFPQAVRVLDLGGGHGEHSLELARRGLHPTVQDLPGVIESARRRGHLRAAGVELLVGDLLTTLPPTPGDRELPAWPQPGRGRVFAADAGVDRRRRRPRRGRLPPLAVRSGLCPSQAHDFDDPLHTLVLAER